MASAQHRLRVVAQVCHHHLVTWPAVFGLEPGTNPPVLLGPGLPKHVRLGYQEGCASRRLDQAAEMQLVGTS